MAYKKLSPYDLPDNFFSRINHDWMLITAGTPQACNTMTASWGQPGILWSRPVVTIFIREERYTRSFVESQPRFSLSFFAPGTHREELQLLGTKSGRDGDKIGEAGLHVADFDGVPAFEEAELVIICRKLYRQDLAEECFVDREPFEECYSVESLHRFYVGEIEAIYRKE